MYLIDEMQIFASVVKAGSFSKASKTLGVSKSFVSKKISALEAALKAQLLARSTRQLYLTEAGRVFYQYCENVLREVSSAYAAVAELQGEVAGLLRVTAGPGLAEAITPVVTQLMLEHPKLEIDLQTDQRVVDIIREGYDLALRSKGELEDSSLIARRLGTIKMHLCAAPHCLKKYGVPICPEDLKRFPFAIPTHIKRMQQVVLRKGGEEHIIKMQGHFFSNDSQVLKQSVLNGETIMFFPQYMVRKELEQKDLLAVLPDYEVQTNTLFAVYLNREYLPKKTKLFIDAITDWL